MSAKNPIEIKQLGNLYKLNYTGRRREVEGIKRCENLVVRRIQKKLNNYNSFIGGFFVVFFKQAHF